MLSTPLIVLGTLALLLCIAGIIEFQNQEIEMLQKKIAEELGFELVDHRLELYARKKQ